MGRNTQVVIENNNLCRGPGGMVGSEKKKKAPVSVGNSFVSPRPLLIPFVNVGRAIPTPSINVLWGWGGESHLSS